jgi:hypothetical protein
MAPEPYFSACLAVLHRAISFTCSNPDDHEQVTDVMNAVRDIPELIQAWERCDETVLRRSLQACDARWPTGLLAAYDFILERRVV